MRFTLLVVVLLFGLVGCEPPQQKAVTTQLVERREADDGPIQPADAVTSEDLAVLDAALAHFARDPEFESGFRPWQDGTRLIVHSTTLGGSAFVRPEQVRVDSGEGNLPEEALSDLERRNNGPLVQVSSMTFSSTRRAGAALVGWSPKSPNVVVEDLGRFPSGRDFEFDDAVQEAYPDVRAYVWAAVPGYTADRRQAVVRLAFGPSVHGAMATYVLTKDADGSWTVTWRKFCYYA